MYTINDELQPAFGVDITGPDGLTIDDDEEVTQ